MMGFLVGELLLPGAAAGAAAGAAMLGIAYMAGKYFQSNMLTMYTRVELEEFILSAVLVGLCVLLVQNAARVEIVHAVSGAPAADQAALDNLIYNAYQFQIDKLQNTMSELAVNALRISRATGFNFNYMTPDPFSIASYSSSKSPLAGGSSIITGLFSGIDQMSTLILLVKSERILYFFMYFISLQFLLPAGFFLRFIPPARKLGGMLISIGICTTLVYPAGMMWSDAMLKNPDINLLPPGTMRMVFDGGSADTFITLLCNEPLSVLYDMGEIIVGLVACLIPCLATGTGFWTCLGAPSMTPPSAGPETGGPACWNSVELWVMGAKYAVQTAATLSFLGHPLTMSGGEYVQKYYEPLTTDHPTEGMGALNYTMRMALGIIAMLIVRMIAVVIIARNLAMFFGSEGQFYGMSKLI